MKQSIIALGCSSKLFERGEDITAIMDACFQYGVPTFDTARGYKRSEEVLHEYLKDKPRDSFYLISKGCLPLPFSRLNPRCLKKDIEKSLTTLDLGYIDLYLLHRDDRRADLEEIFSILNEYKSAGKIKSYGVSNWTMERIQKANDLCKAKGFAPIQAVSNNFTALPWAKDPWGGGDGCVSLTGKEEELAYLKENNIPLFAYSPLARGFLTGRVSSTDPSTFHNVDKASRRAYLSSANLARLNRIEDIAKSLGVSVPDLVLSYLCHLDLEVIPVIGTTSPNRLKANVEAAEKQFPQEIYDELRALSIG